MNLVTFVIGSFAVWRLSHAIVRENGPLMVFARLRARLGRTQKRSGGFFDMISCTSCLSMWIGLVASLWTATTFFNWIGYGFAFSGGAMLIETLFAKQPNPLTVITHPAADDKVLVRTSATPEQGNNMVGHQRTTDGSLAVKTVTVLDH